MNSNFEYGDVLLCINKINNKPYIVLCRGDIGIKNGENEISFKGQEIRFNQGHYGKPTRYGCSFYKKIVSNNNIGKLLIV